MLDINIKNTDIFSLELTQISEVAGLLILFFQYLLLSNNDIHQNFLSFFSYSTQRTVLTNMLAAKLYQQTYLDFLRETVMIFVKISHFLSVEACQRGDK